MFRQRWITQGTRLSMVLGLLALGLSALDPPVRAGEEAAAETAGAAEAAWAPLKLLVGTWEGEIDGKLGTGRGVRRYELILGDQFLLSRHRSIRLPQPKSPEGDQHEELAVFSFDAGRGTLVYREFMTEGIVVRSPCQVEGRKVVCTSESVENGPGIRARLTLEITDRYRFTEIYELAFPGRELEHYFTNRWTRSPASPGWD